MLGSAEMRLLGGFVGGVLVLALSGCSSGPPPLTKAEYLTRANAICKTYNRRLDAALGSASASNRGELVKTFATALQLGVAQENELKALVPPKEDEATVNAMFAAYDRAVKAVPAFNAAAAKGDQSEVIDFTGTPPADLQGPVDDINAAGAESDRLFDAYGASECGSGSASG
jgi:hypothetical protein